MPLTTTRELFVHELADAMSAEHIILEMLPELAKEATDPELQTALRDHEKETRQHVKNLEAVFKALGEQPEPTTCHAAEGLRQEHQALHEEQPTPEILQMANVTGAAKTESYEITSYTALVRMAKEQGERDVTRLLQENLDQEKAMAKRLDAVAKALGDEAKAAAKEGGDARKAEEKRAGD